MALVSIPTNEYINGVSPNGSRQTIDARALPNLLAFARAFYAALGVRLDVSEASRSRPRQRQLWNEWQAYLARGKRAPWAALAARPYTSKHDEVNHGNAVDLGSRIGTFASAAHQWAVINGPAYGVRPTGLNFSSPEPWHFEIDITTTAASEATLISDDPDQPQDQTEDEDMAKNSGFHYHVGAESKNHIVVLICNTESGFVHEFSAGPGKGFMLGNYNNGVAIAYGTGAFAKITEQDAASLKTDLAAVRASKSAAPVEPA